MSSNRLLVLAGLALWLFPLVGAGPASCNSNDSGNFAARGTGDVSHGQVERSSPLQLFDEACGTSDKALRGGRSLRRAPYLQQVTTDGAAVVWTVDAGDAAGQLVVRTVAGEPVTTVRGQVDPAARLPGGGRQLVARLDRLLPATTYCYEVQQAGARVAGPLPLRTAPLPGAGPVRFLALGDSGEGGADQAGVLRQMRTVPFDLIVHMGDIAYDDGRLEDFERKFFAVYEDLLRSLPIFPASGNHEYNTDDAKPFRQVFVLPENGGPQGRERWYSFDWGDVHFVALDTEKMGPVQAAWLDEDLSRTRLPWTVVYGHRPPFSSGEHGGDLSFRKTFGPILERHRVPLVLSGHDHHYERFRPRNGVTYVITGGGGRGTRPVTPGPDTVYAEAVLNFVLVTVEGDRLTLHAIDGAGRQFDSTTIARPERSAMGGTQAIGDGG